MWGINRRRKGIDHTWAALKTLRAARPDGAPIYVILDNLSAHLNWRIRRWADRNKVELCFTPTYASWANPIEAHFGPLRQFTLANSNHPHHTVQTRVLHACLRWRNKNARHPEKKVPLAGKHFLEIKLSPAAAHNNAGRNVHKGPRLIKLSLPKLKGFALTGDFEGVVTFGAAFDSKPSYTTKHLHRPERFVLDIAHHNTCRSSH
jgi:hypothetical protein